MTAFHLTGDALWERMDRADRKVEERLERTAITLERAGISYAIIGGNAVRAWVAQADEAAVRSTRDVDILLRREDFPQAVVVMQAACFIYRQVKSIDMILNGPDANARDAVHVTSRAKRCGQRIWWQRPISLRRKRFSDIEL